MEYAALLQAKRRQLVPDAPAVVFDAAPLKGVVEHNWVMEASNKLFHADQARCVELMGMNNGLWQCRQNPKLLAQAIWSQFQASVKGHCEAQVRPVLNLTIYQSFLDAPPRGDTAKRWA